MNKKRKVIIIVVISLLLIVLLMLLWFNRKKIVLYNETVTIIKETCSVDLTKLEVEYKYKTKTRFYIGNLYMLSGICRRGTF